MAILSKKKEKATPKAESGAQELVSKPNDRKFYQKFRLQDNGFNRAKIEMFQDHRDDKWYPEKDREGRLTVYLEKLLKDKVFLSDLDAAILNEQAVNSKIIYLISEKQKQFDHPVDPRNKMFNIVNEIGK